MGVLGSSIYEHSPLPTQNISQSTTTNIWQKFLEENKKGVDRKCGEAYKQKHEQRNTHHINRHIGHRDAMGK